MERTKVIQQISPTAARVRPLGASRRRGPREPSRRRPAPALLRLRKPLQLFEPSKPLQILSQIGRKRSSCATDGIGQWVVFDFKIPKSMAYEIKPPFLRFALKAYDKDTLKKIQKRKDPGEAVLFQKTLKAANAAFEWAGGRGLQDPRRREGHKEDGRRPRLDHQRCRWGKVATYHATRSK